MKKNTNLSELNAKLEKKVVTSKGRTFENLLLSVKLNNGQVVTFEVTSKFYNRKFDYLIKQNINEAK